MEVDQYEFKTRLLGILASICNASFISFDLEMSGINRRTKEQQNAARNRPKPTLEEHYKGMREAAESYQVLQVGICCVEEVREKRFYLARPYNFNLSPLEVDPKHPMFDMDRQMKFSGEACKFLALERFDFGKVFSCGVTYLSRVEEAGLRQSKAPGRNEKRRDIEFTLGDPGYVFYEKLRDTITAWAKDAKPNSYINISHPDGPEFDLNGLQRRLVHQLLANEFPTFKAHSKDKGAWMQVRPIIAAQEAEEETRDQEKFRRKISRQIGLRWVIEALINGNLDGIPVDWFYDNHSEDPRRQKAAVDELFDSLKTRLKKKKHIIVGHNLFADLGFLYSTFIGALPPTVTEFQKVIHEAFPVVMDTKYIATANHDSMSSQGKLMDLLRPLRKVNGPMIVLDEEHLNYAGVEKEHEAGFDSWITAELFLKVSMQLYDARKKVLNIEDSDSDEEFYEEDLIDMWDGQMDDNLPAGWHSDQLNSVHLHYNSPPNSPVSSASSPQKKSSSTPPPQKGPPKINRMRLKSSTYNPYEMLADLGDALDDDSTLSPTTNTLNKTSPKSIRPTKSPQKKSQVGAKKLRQWLPNLNSPFWDLYVNKLRVNSADTGVCDLNPPSSATPSDEGGVPI